MLFSFDGNGDDFFAHGKLVCDIGWQQGVADACRNSKDTGFNVIGNVAYIRQKAGIGKCFQDCSGLTVAAVIFLNI